MYEKYAKDVVNKQKKAKEKYEKKQKKLENKLARKMAKKISNYMCRFAKTECTIVLEPNKGYYKNRRKSVPLKPLWPRICCKGFYAVAREAEIVKILNKKYGYNICPTSKVSSCHVYDITLNM